MKKPLGIAILAGCLVAFALPVHAQSPKAVISTVQTADETGLQAAEDARFAAQIHKDAAAIAAGMADEVVYVHASGLRQTKAEYLDGLIHGPMSYNSITINDRTAKVFGNVGFTRALYTIGVGNQTLRSSYLSIYVHRDGRWQLLSWQTTPIDSQMPFGPPQGAGTPSSQSPPIEGPSP